MRFALVALSVLGMVLAVAPAVPAVQFKVESQTVGDAYQLVTSGNELLNRRRLHQYLGFGAYDLLGDGEYKLNVTTLFRFDTDFGLTDEELRNVDKLERERLSIQYAWVEGRDVAGFIDFRLGRQLHADALDYLMLDGAVVQFNTPWYFGVELLGGLETKQDAFSLNRSNLELDGVRFIDSERIGIENDEPTIAVGAALVSRDLQHTRIRVGYRRLFSKGEVDQEKVGGTFYQSIAGRLHLHGSASYDFYNEHFDRAQLGARWQITDYLDLDAQYVRLLPSFDADSIFNIFTAFAMNDVNARVTLHPTERQRVYLGAMVRLFGNEGYTDGPLIGDVDTVVEATGLMAGYAIAFRQHGRAHLDLSYEGGYGGDRALIDLGGTWALVPGEWELDGRLTTVIFDDELQPNLNATSFGYQLGGRYLVDKKLGVTVMAEHNFNRLHKQQLRVFAVVDVNVFL